MAPKHCTQGEATQHKVGQLFPQPLSVLGLVHPRLQLALVAARAHCWPTFSLLSARTPQIPFCGAALQPLILQLMYIATFRIWHGETLNICTDWWREWRENKGKIRTKVSLLYEVKGRTNFTRNAILVFKPHNCSICQGSNVIYLNISASMTWL